MHLHRADGALAHRHFGDLAELLAPGDLLVTNDTKVVPARLVGTKETGGQVEVFITRPLADGAFEAIFHMSGRARPGLTITVAGAKLQLEEALEEGVWRIRLLGEADPLAFLEASGQVPLPPYIKRGAENALSGADRERYQTVYAAIPGAVAAPTAGLHFTPELLAALRARGIGQARVTLHVSLGTFHTPRENDLERITLHPEDYILPQETIDAMNATRRNGGRIVAVGTTTVRVLETARRGGLWHGHAGTTRLFIRPGSTIETIDALITNFHLPRSTLLVLVSVFAGREATLGAYAAALGRRYRFFSYGDAMFID